METKKIVNAATRESKSSLNLIKQKKPCKFIACKVFSSSWKSRTKYSKPDDEYYTSYKTAERFLKPVIKKIKGKKVICPMDNETSNIYLYLKDNKIDVDLAPSGDGLKHNAFFVDYSKYEYVITNPAFSLIKELLEKIKNNKWLLICPTYIPHYAYFRPFLKKAYWTVTMSINDWTNKKRSIAIRFISNFSVPYPKYLQREFIDVKLNQDYSINVINKKWDVKKPENKIKIVTQKNHVQKHQLLP